MGIQSVPIGSNQVMQWTVDIVMSHLSASNLKEEYVATLIKTVHATLTELATKGS